MAEATASATSTQTTQSPAGAASPASASHTPSKSDQPNAAPAAASKTFKIKVDGKEQEVSESELLELASAGKAANQRFQDAAKMRKEAEQWLKLAEQDPSEFFKRTGKDPRKWSEEFLLRELQKEAETPEQKKARENEEALRQYRDKEKKDAENKESQDREKLTNSERERLDKLFTQALYESGLPRTKFTVKRMAELQLINIKNKFELKPDQLAKLVREDYINEQKSLLGALEGDQLLDFLGPEITKKFSKAQIAKLKSRGGGGGSSKGGPVARNQPETGMTWREYQKKNRGRA